MHCSLGEDNHVSMRVGGYQILLQPCHQNPTDAKGASSITVDDGDAFGSVRGQALIEAESSWAVCMMRKDRVD